MDALGWNAMKRDSEKEYSYYEVKFGIALLDVYVYNNQFDYCNKT